MGTSRDGGIVLCFQPPGLGQAVTPGSRLRRVLRISRWLGRDDALHSSMAIDRVCSAQCYCLQTLVITQMVHRVRRRDPCRNKSVGDRLTAIGVPTSDRSMKAVTGRLHLATYVT